MNKKFVDHIKILLSKGKIGQAIKEMIDEMDQLPIYKDIIIISNRFYFLNKRSNSGLINNQELEVERTKISYSILYFLEPFEKREFINEKEELNESKKEKNIFFQLSEFLTKFMQNLADPSLFYYPIVIKNKTSKSKDQSLSNIGLRINPQLIKYGLFSLIFGTIINICLQILGFNGISTTNLSNPYFDLIFNAIVIFTGWISLAIVIHAIIRLLSGNTHFLISFSAIFQVLATSFIACRFMLLMASLVLKDSLNNIIGGEEIYLLFQLIFLSIYLPIAIIQVHDFKNKANKIGAVLLILAIIFIVVAINYFV